MCLRGTLDLVEVMATPLDLTLPTGTIFALRYRDQPMQTRPAALYTLVDVTDVELQEIREICESKCEAPNPGVNVRLPPQAKFVGESLRAVFDYHLELGGGNTFDPMHFIAAIDRNWRANGVLLVTLDNGDQECKVDSFCIRAEDSGLTVVNIQIGNSDWSEQKETYAIELHKGDGLGESDDGDGSDGGDGNGKQNVDDEDGNNSGPEIPKGPPSTGYYIGTYVLEGLDAETIIRTIEPFASMKKRSEFCCTLQSIISATADPVDQAFMLHPIRCRTNPWLQKQLLLIADTTSPSEYGLVLGHLSWDGSTSNKSQSELRSIAASAPRKTQRVPFSASGAIQNAFCSIANGARAWQPLHSVFVVFQYNHGRQELDTTAELIDKQWTRRPEGEDCIIFAPTVIQPKKGKAEHIKYSFDETVRRFPALCRKFRFTQNLVKQYFICVDNANIKKDGVLLTRMEWDGDVNKTEDELMQLRVKDEVTVLRVPVEEAYETLRAVVEGARSWLGEMPE